jgi:ABC-type multidrug transport system fused ATPase/permease subunit
MQQQLFDRLLRSEWHGKEIHHSGDVLNRLEIDVNTVVNFLTEVIPNTLSVICLFIGSFGILFQMDASLAIITVGILPVFVLLSRLYIGKMRNLTRLVRDCESHVQSIIQETIQHRMLIKTLECDDTMVNKLEERQSTLREKVRNRTIFSIFSQLMLNVGFSAGYIIAFLWSALRLYQKVITFGDMMAFLQLVYRIQGPARDLTRLAPAFVGVFTAAERLMELDETPQEEQGTPIRFKAPAGIRLKDVRYSYDGNSKIVLDNMSYDFTPGSCTAILGETGAGKTTIIRLLLALIHPISGQVELYNAKRNLPISPRMRCNLIYVPQGNTLLSGTIRENLYLGKLYATDDELKEVLHLACADFVYDLPDGLETRCGEGGGGLSEGQAQRIAIARALLREGNILLLDEATSALDMETERELLSKVFNKENQKTVIFVTHRPAVIDYCDNVLHLGTHD